MKSESKLFGFAGTSIQFQNQRTQLSKVIGDGSYSVVYLGLSKNEKYAVKISFAKSRVEIHMLKLMKKCSFVVNIEDWFEWDGITYIVMEFCDVNLFHLIVRGLGKDK